MSETIDDNTLRMSTFAYALLENYEVYGHTEDEYELGSRDTLIEYIGSLENRIAEIETAQRWTPVSERLPDGGHREFYEVACIYQDFGELALFSKGRWVIYEGENIYDVTERVMFWRKRQYLPDEVIAILSKGKAKPEVQE